MSTLTDTAIPYSRLAFQSETEATATLDGAEPEIISALLMRVVRHHAEGAAGEGTAVPVSVTVDMTGAAAKGEITFRSRIDRQTRTIIFIGGEAETSQGTLLKATAVYRIA